MVFPNELCWNMIFFVLSGKMIFLFPDMILHVRWKMEDDLSLKIRGNMIFSSGLLKIWSFQRCRHMIFLALSGKMVFFSRKHDLFALGRKRKTAFPSRKYMETWCIAQRIKKTGNLIHRVEVWPLLKFIRLEIFHN